MIFSMLPKLHKIKGIHPGSLLKWELDNLGLKSAELAREIGEHKQTISAIINKRRGITPSLSIKLAQIFKTDQDYFMLLQASYDVKSIANSSGKTSPNKDKIRKILFWDTDFDQIDWDQNKSAVIQRVLERGNQEEIKEIISFYGKPTILKEIKQIQSSRIASYEKNLQEFDLA